METEKGIHHVTAVAGNPRQNYRFYADKLGLRLVKKTVNFDDPSNYHLYYGNETGSPGTVLSFFPSEQVQQGHPDRGQAIAVSLSIPPDSLDFWEDRLNKKNIDYVEPFTRFDREVIGFQDPDGLHLELIADPAASGIDGWNKGEGDGKIPDRHAIRGIHGITLAEGNVKPTGALLAESLGFKETDRLNDRIRYESPATLGSVVEIIHEADLDGRPGKGTVHHVAFRAADKDEQEQMGLHLQQQGYHLTETKDRRYFHSIYFHEPGGVLFEVATDPPGFTLDEPAGELGSKLKLPPRLENRRDLIEAELPELEPG